MPIPPFKRIIVLGDIHADYDALIMTLKKAKLINCKLQWIGGKTVLIQIKSIDNFQHTRIFQETPKKYFKAFELLEILFKLFILISFKNLRNFTLPASLNSLS